MDSESGGRAFWCNNSAEVVYAPRVLTETSDNKELSNESGKQGDESDPTLHAKIWKSLIKVTEIKAK